MRIFRAAANIAKALMRRYRLLRYDDFTIGDFLRSQGASIGDNCRILIRNLGSEPYLVHIGNHCTISGDVVFLTHDGATWVFTEELPSLQRFGTIEILDNCFIGYGAILMPNIRIGPNSIVGAGAVVTKHVPPNTVVAGSPAKLICTLEEYKDKVLATWRLQKPPGYVTDLHDGEHYAPADIQKEKGRNVELLRAHLQNLLWNSSPQYGYRPDQGSPLMAVPPPSPSMASSRERRRSVQAHHGGVAGRSRSSE